MLGRTFAFKAFAFMSSSSPVLDVAKASSHTTTTATFADIDSLACNGLLPITMSSNNSIYLYCDARRFGTGPQPILKQHTIMSKRKHASKLVSTEHRDQANAIRRGYVV
jgi:hypothetical protein